MRRAAARSAPARDLFEPPVTGTPPKEFADLLVERGLAAVLPAAPTAEAPVPAPPPAEAPVEAPPASSVRHFVAETERVQLGKLMVIRERGADGHHTYCAYERADAFFYGVTLDELTWGRIDRRRSLRQFDPYTEHAALVMWELECSAEARAVIRKLCPETRLAAHETAPGAGVYDGPGYVLLTVDPAFRYRAAIAREVPT